MDESARGNAVLPVMGIPLKEIYNRASGDYFGPALEDPAKYAKWVFVNVEAEERGARTPAPRTWCTRRSVTNPSFTVRYSLAFSTPTHRIYERSSD